MQAAKIGEDAGREQIIERQMRLWALTHPVTNARETHPGYKLVTISRQTGCLAEEIGHELSMQIGWHVFDKEIVDYIAYNKHVRQELVRQLDERSRGLVEDTIERFLTMVEEGSFGQEDYHDGLINTLALIAAKGNAIIIGRGANFALKDRLALHIRIIGSVELRVCRLAARWQVPAEEARRRMLAQDTERRRFVRHHFGHDLETAAFYNAILNTDHLTVSQVVSCIRGLLAKSESAGQGIAVA